MKTHHIVLKPLKLKQKEHCLKMGWILLSVEEDGVMYWFYLQHEHMHMFFLDLCV